MKLSYHKTMKNELISEILLPNFSSGTKLQADFFPFSASAFGCMMTALDWRDGSCVGIHFYKVLNSCFHRLCCCFTIKEWGSYTGIL